jgi:adenylosuccinate lyase
MPYKRNPMRSERICGLARFLSSLPGSAAQTAATQWLERTLDDSAHRRLTIPQGFLAADAILRLLINVTDGLVVYPKSIESNLNSELPFLASENILMAAVKAGGNRQDLHERIRVHSLAAGDRVKREGLPNDMLDRLRSDPAFSSVEWSDVLDPRAFVGRAPQQVDEFLAEQIEPILREYASTPAEDAVLEV